jgi:hypothetical protein
MARTGYLQNSKCVQRAGVNCGWNMFRVFTEMIFHSNLSSSYIRNRFYGYLARRCIGGGAQGRRCPTREVLYLAAFSSAGLGLNCCLDTHRDQPGMASRLLCTY